MKQPTVARDAPKAKGTKYGENNPLPPPPYTPGARASVTAHYRTIIGSSLVENLINYRGTRHTRAYTTRVREDTTRRDSKTIEATAGARDPNSGEKLRSSFTAELARAARSRILHRCGASELPPRFPMSR